MVHSEHRISIFARSSIDLVDLILDLGKPNVSSHFVSVRDLRSCSLAVRPSPSMSGSVSVIRANFAVWMGSEDDDSSAAGSMMTAENIKVFCTLRKLIH